MAALPNKYAWLADEPGPRILLQALKSYGVKETPGPANSSEIMAWAKRTQLNNVYKEDSTAWCGLWMAYTSMEAGWDVTFPNPLAARQWVNWGEPIQSPELGNVLVFWRGSKNGWMGHVGMYVGEDAEAYHVLGGNQSDMVSIKRISRDRLLQARECPWRVSKPANARKVILEADGTLSEDES